MVESSPQSRYVLRLVRSCENRQMATIKYHAFNDPTNPTPDEISTILASEIDSSTGTIPTMQQTIENTMTKQELELFNDSKYIVVGVYSLPSSSSFSSSEAKAEEEGEGEDDEDLKDSSDLPPESELVGFSIWQHITPNTPLDHPTTDKKESLDPSLSNRFFAQMNRTRESLMSSKSYYFLKLLSIHPSHQRKGLGSILLNWGTKKAHKQNIDVWLESSPMGKSTYLKAGFKILGFDQIPEKRAKRGFVDWPYMIYNPQNPSLKE